MASKTAKIINRCVADVARNPVKYVDVYLEDDITVWHLALHYPAESPFMGGPEGSLTASGFALYVTMQFSEDFPARPPKLKFLSPWINHQHLWGDRICHSLLTDDFGDYFREKQTHGTSMWNSACALADGDGIGGMPRYLQVLREYLANDLDYEEEQHVRYDQKSLLGDVKALQEFCPDFFETATLLEPEQANTSKEADPAAKEVGVDSESAPADDWGTDFFLKQPLRTADPDFHPCFDVAVTALPNRSISLSTSMATLCRKSFELGARVTDFGSSIQVLLPFPCTRKAWEAVGSMQAALALEELLPVTERYRVSLPGIEDEADSMEAILNVIGEIWRSTCISIVRDQGYESERAMLCFVTLHFLLLCLSEENPNLKTHATTTVKSFTKLIKDNPGENLKACVPDLGRFLVRFLLTDEDASLHDNANVIVQELLSRNVRWVPYDNWADSEASPEEKELQIKANFSAGHFGMKLTVFQSYYILRSTELGLNTLSFLERCLGKPSSEVMRVFQDDCKKIKALSSFSEFYTWLQLDPPSDEALHEKLCDAVDESEERGYNQNIR